MINSDWNGMERKDEKTKRWNIVSSQNMRKCWSTGVQPSKINTTRADVKTNVDRYPYEIHCILHVHNAFTRPEHVNFCCCCIYLCGGFDLLWSYSLWILWLCSGANVYKYYNCYFPYFFLFLSLSISPNIIHFFFLGWNEK